VVEELYAFTGKCSQTKAMQTMKHFPLVIVSLEGMEHVSLLLSSGEGRNPPRHLTLRSVSCILFKRIWGQHETATELNIVQVTTA
jgi:hypothetical protein